MLPLVTAIAIMASLLLPAAPAAAGTLVYANGGRYFAASGPTAYWHYDYGEGYCGRWAGWCSPKHSQWTYGTRAFGGVNNATWSPIIEDKFSRAFAFIPRRNATTRGAVYTVAYWYNYRSTSEVDQMSYYDQWVPLAYGDLLRQISSVSLTDATFEAGTTKVAFDEIKIEN